MIRGTGDRSQEPVVRSQSSGVSILPTPHTPHPTSPQPLTPFTYDCF
ncbi:hypothetical protein BFG60_0459 [Microcystis aeruginosa NIES-98]|nr:hypothetical protein BFG60_0459 [Microcystis aeruginosa NIES-98]